MEISPEQEKGNGIVFFICRDEDGIINEDDSVFSPNFPGLYLL